jgi:hypothetical protein
VQGCRTPASVRRLPSAGQRQGQDVLTVPRAAAGAGGRCKVAGAFEKFGVKLDMVPLPLSSSPIGRSENPHIMLGKDPERDKEIEQICTMIRS